MRLVTRVESVNRKSTLARLFIYPSGEIVEVNIPTRYYSYNLDRATADRMFAKIQSDPELQGSAKIVKVGEGTRRERTARWAIIYDGMRYDWKHLSDKMFWVHKSAGKGEQRDSIKQRLIEHLGLPFAVVDESYSFDRRLSLEELLEFKTECWDIEVGNYPEEVFGHIKDLGVSLETMQEFSGLETGDREELVAGVIEQVKSDNEHVYNIGYSCGDELYLFTLHPVENFEFECFLGKFKVNVRRYDNQVDLVRGFVEEKRRQNALLSIGQNFMAYDRVRLRRFVGDAFAEGMDGSMPVQEALCGFFPRIIAKGFYSLDTASDSQHWNPGTFDNKLFTIFRHFFAGEYGLDVIESEVKKQHSYEDQTKMRIEAMLGNLDVAQTLAEYCVTDVVVNHMIGEKVLEHVYDMGLLFLRKPDSICTSARKTLAVRHWDRRFLSEMHTMESRKALDEKLRVAESREDQQSYKDFNPQAVRLFERDFRVGLFEGCSLIYPTIFLKTLLPIVLADEEASRIYRKIRDVDDSVKIRYLLGLQAWLKRPIVDVLHSDDEFKFRDAYGMELGEARERLREFTQMFKNLLPSEVNHSDYFSVVKGDVGELRRKRLGLLVSNGRVLSTERSRFAWFANNNLYTQGINIYSKRGYKTNYERKLVANILEEILINGNPERARLVYEEGLKNLKDVHRADLVIARERMVRDYFEYSSLAARIKFIQQAVLHGAEKGESFGYGFSTKGETEVSVFMESKVAWDVYEQRLNGFLWPIVSAGLRSPELSKQLELL